MHLDAPLLLDGPECFLDVVDHPGHIANRVAVLGLDHVLDDDDQSILEALHQVVDLDDCLAKVDDLVHNLGAHLVDEFVAQLDRLRLEVKGRVLGRLDLKPLDDRNLEVDARADHANGSSEVELQGMLAVIDHDKDACNYLQEFEHCIPRNEDDPRVDGQSRNASAGMGSRLGRSRTRPWRSPRLYTPRGQSRALVSAARRMDEGKRPVPPCQRVAETDLCTPSGIIDDSGAKLPTVVILLPGCVWVQKAKRYF